MATIEADFPAPLADEAAPTRGAELRAHWPIVAIAFLGMMIGVWGLPVFLLGPLSISLEKAFHWPRTEIAFASTFMAMGVALGTPLVGFLADRIPLRLIAMVALSMLAIGVGGIAFLDGQIWQYYLLYFIIAFLGAGSGGVIYTRAIGGWFRSARGIALGIALSGGGAAAIATPLVVQWLLSIMGWREACLTLAAAVLMLMPIVVIGLKIPKAGQIAVAGAPATSGMSRGEAMRDRRFYFLQIAVGLYGLFIGSVIVHLVPMMIDRGVTPAHAAQIASLQGIAIIVGRLVIGSLFDRLPPPIVGCCAFALGAVGPLLFFLGGTPFLIPMALTTGLLMGAEVDILSYFTLYCFGNRYSGSIFGVLFSGYACCAMMSPFVTKALIMAGGYDFMFVGAAAGFMTAGLMLLAVGRRPRLNANEPAMS